MTEVPNELKLPQFIKDGVIKETQHFRVVMGYKPGLEDQQRGVRFFICPLDDESDGMLQLAAKAHNIPNFNEKTVETPNGATIRQCLRADFIVENLPALLLEQVDIPPEGQDSVPSPERMEECLKIHSDRYTFQD